MRTTYFLFRVGMTTFFVLFLVNLIVRRISPVTLMVEFTTSLGNLLGVSVSTAGSIPMWSTGMTSGGLTNLFRKVERTLGMDFSWFTDILGGSSVDINPTDIINNNSNLGL
ncbi:hypothetical protein D3C81_11520 [compost metagenome]